jgi:ABC-type polysaccharide/polyol phosphate transport system ATPase subunit
LKECFTLVNMTSTLWDWLLHSIIGKTGYKGRVRERGKVMSSLEFHSTSKYELTEKKYQNVAAKWSISGFSFNTPPKYESDVLTFTLLNCIIKHKPVTYRHNFPTAHY